MAGGRTRLPTWLTTTRRSTRSILRLLFRQVRHWRTLSVKRGGIEANPPGVASENRFSVGVRGSVQATFLPHSRFEAISAPARSVAILAHTTSSVTHSQP